WDYPQTLYVGDDRGDRGALDLAGLVDLGIKKMMFDVHHIVRLCTGCCAVRILRCVMEGRPDPRLLVFIGCEFYFFGSNAHLHQRRCAVWIDGEQQTAADFFAVD